MIRLAWNYALLGFGIVLFTAICFVWAVVAWVLWPLLPARTGRKVGRFGAMAGFRAWLWSMDFAGALRLDLRELDAIAGMGPVIVAPNHPGLLDAVLMVSRMPDAVCVMKGSLLRYFLLAPAARLARYVPNASLLRLMRKAADEIRHGGQLLLFPEGTRTVGGPIGPLTEAVGAIAKRTQTPVQTVIIEASAPFLGKAGAPWPPTFPIAYRARLGRRYDPPRDVRAFTEELDRHFRRELAGAAPESPGHGPVPVVEDAQQLRG